MNGGHAPDCNEEVYLAKVLNALRGKQYKHKNVYLVRNCFFKNEGVMYVNMSDIDFFKWDEDGLSDTAAKLKVRNPNSSQRRDI